MFYPTHAPVPTGFSTDEFLVRPLRITDVELDYDAVISSREELLLWSGGDWPVEGFPLEANLADLHRHEREHNEGVAFTYTIMNPTETECLGCIYIAPMAVRAGRAGASAEQITSIGDYEAWVNFWVRHSRLADELDRRVLITLLDWLKTQWAFKRVVLAARKEQSRQVQIYTDAGLHLFWELPHSLVYAL